MSKLQRQTSVGRQLSDIKTDGKLKLRYDKLKVVGH
jgi:hypothetical protein